MKDYSQIMKNMSKKFEPHLLNEDGIHLTYSIKPPKLDTSTEVSEALSSGENGE